jgi:hypothetical protein
VAIDGDGAPAELGSKRGRPADEREDREFRAAALSFWKGHGKSDIGAFREELKSWAMGTLKFARKVKDKSGPSDEWLRSRIAGFTAEASQVENDPTLWLGGSFDSHMMTFPWPHLEAARRRNAVKRKVQRHAAAASDTKSKPKNTK